MKSEMLFEALLIMKRIQHRRLADWKIISESTYMLFDGNSALLPLPCAPNTVVAIECELVVARLCQSWTISHNGGIMVVEALVVTMMFAVMMVVTLAITPGTVVIVKLWSSCVTILEVVVRRSCVGNCRVCGYSNIVSG